MPDASTGLAAQVARYGLVGLANTALGLAVILGLDLGLHAPPLLANACGYGAGIALGFALNRGFVFGSQANAGRTGPRYLAAVAVCYALNAVVLMAGRACLGQGGLAHSLSQIAAMGAYTVGLFLLSRYWVFAGAATR